VRKLLRPGTLIYFAAWLVVGLGLLYTLLTRDRLQVNVLADRKPQFVVLSDDSICNGYTVKLLNMIPEPHTVIG
jgi:polyferredoxin